VTSIDYETTPVSQLEVKRRIIRKTKIEVERLTGPVVTLRVDGTAFNLLAGDSIDLTISTDLPTTAEELHY
jgi:hypothetical protein